MLLEPHRHGAQAAQREEDVVGADADDRAVRCAFLSAGNALRVGRHAAEHDVGVAADIFGAGLDRDVDAFLERLEIEWRCPGIVH